ncbi:hypothetical protein GCM10027258_48630 [Amycolatopsis stemonae]
MFTVADAAPERAPVRRPRPPSRNTTPGPGSTAPARPPPSTPVRPPAATPPRMPFQRAKHERLPVAAHRLLAEHRDPAARPGTSYPLSLESNFTNTETACSVSFTAAFTQSW